MENIKKNYSKIYGYLPTDSEILNLYLSGNLCLTDTEENQLIRYFNLN